MTSPGSTRDAVPLTPRDLSRGASGEPTIPWRSISLALIPIVLAASSLGDWLILSPDSFTYLRFARCLCETGHLPFARLVAPPLFPLVLAPFMALGDLPLLAVRILLTLAWAACGVLAFHLYRRELGRWPAWIVGLFVATHSDMMFQSPTLLSELVYMPLSLGTLVMFARWRQRNHLGTASLIAGALLVTATIMTRSMGVMLLPVGALVLLARSRDAWRTRLVRIAVFGSLALVVMFTWNRRENHYPAGNAYGDFLARARPVEHTSATGMHLQLERFVRFGNLRLDAITALVLPRRVCWRLLASPWGGWIQWAVGSLVIGLLLLRVVRKRAPAEAYALLLLALLAIWPFDEGVRFVLPLLPILAGSLMWAMLGAYQRAKSRAVTRAAAILASCAIILGLSIELTVTRERFDDAHTKAVHRLADMRDLAGWIRQHVPSDAAILCVTPDGDESKTRLTGGAYIARVPASHFLDVYDSDLSALPPLRGRCAFVHHTLADQAEVVWGCRRKSNVSHFAVFMPEARHVGEPREKRALARVGDASSLGPGD